MRSLFSRKAQSVVRDRGAKMSGASLVIGIDRVPARLEMAKHMGADVVLNDEQQDVVAEIKKLTGGGVDVAIEALGTQPTFENALRCDTPRRHALEPRRYSGQSVIAARCIRGRARRPHSGDHPLSWWKGAHASVDEHRPCQASAIRSADHAFVLTRSDRRSVRPIRPSARRRAEGCDPPLDRAAHRAAELRDRRRLIAIPATASAAQKPLQSLLRLPPWSGERAARVRRRRHRALRLSSRFALQREVAG